MSPNSAPATPIATHQPMVIGRTSRIASPVGPESSRRCGRLRARSGSRLAPTSRVPASSVATAATTAVKTATGSRASGWGAVRGRSSSTQPSGETQISPCSPTPASAIIRTA